MVVGSPDERRATLQRLNTLAHILDSVFRIPFTGVRIGLDPILGFVPGLGDVAGAIASAYIVFAAAFLGAPKSILLRMSYNMVVEALMGVVPLVGDLFDAGWKANLRNVELLDRYLEQPGAASVTSRWFLGAVAGALVLLVVGIAVFAFFIFTTVIALLGG